MALGSSRGCIVPQDRRLLWPYPSFCPPPGSLFVMSAWSYACAPAAEVPQFTLPILCDVPSSILRWFQQVHLTISSLLMLSSQQLQGARQPRVPANPEQTGCPLEAAMFALCYGPHALLALLWSGLLLPSFRRWGRPQSLRRISLHTSWFIVYYHGRIFPGRIGSLMGCGGVWTFFDETLARTLARTRGQFTPGSFQTKFALKSTQHNVQTPSFVR